MAISWASVGGLFLDLTIPVIAVSLVIYVTMRYEEALGGRRRRARHIFELTRYRLIGVIETVPSRVFQ
jgi:hypothetical protein